MSTKTKVVMQVVLHLLKTAKGLNLAQIQAWILVMVAKSTLLEFARILVIAMNCKITQTSSMVNWWVKTWAQCRLSVVLAKVKSRRNHHYNNCASPKIKIQALNSNSKLKLHYRSFWTLRILFRIKHNFNSTNSKSYKINLKDSKQQDLMGK